MRLPFFAATALLSTILVAAPASAKDKKPQDPEKRICHTEVPTGSVMGKSVCHTRREWAEVENQNQANTDRMMQSQRAAGH